MDSPSHGLNQEKILEFEYFQTIEKDGALERRFQLLRVEEPTAEEAVGILTALRERLEAHHGVKLEDDALRAAVEWSVRYQKGIGDHIDEQSG